MNKTILKWLMLALMLVQMQPIMAASEAKKTVIIPNDKNLSHTVSGIGKITGNNFDPKNVRVSLDGGKTWVAPDSVVIRTDGTFAWAMTTSIQPGTITVAAAIFDPVTAAVVKTDLVATVLVSQKPPEVAAAVRAVEHIPIVVPQSKSEKEEKSEKEKTTTTTTTKAQESELQKNIRALTKTASPD